MMQLCSDRHVEVCFTLISCPVCFYKQEMEDLEFKVRSMSEEINRLESELWDLKEGKEECPTKDFY